MHTEMDTSYSTDVLSAETIIEEAKSYFDSLDHFFENRRTEQDFEEKFSDSKKFFIEMERQDYGDITGFTAIIDDIAAKKKAEVLRKHHDGMAQSVANIKENVEALLIYDFVKEKVKKSLNPDVPLDVLRENLQHIYPEKLDPLLAPIDYDAIKAKVAETIRSTFENNSNINFDECTDQIVTSVKRLFDQKVHDTHDHIVQNIYRAFMTSFSGVAPDPSKISYQSVPQRLAESAKKPFIDQMLPSAIKAAYDALRGMFDDEHYLGHYFGFVRHLVTSMHDIKCRVPPCRYLKMKFPRGADPTQVVNNLRESLGVVLPQDAYTLVKRSVVPNPGNSGDGNGSALNSEEMFLVFAFANDEDYKRCLLHTTRVGESGSAVMECCPTIQVTSKRPLQQVPFILENVAKFNTDLLSISTDYPDSTASGADSANSGEFRATAVCTTEDWANIIASRPELFFAYTSVGDAKQSDDIRVAVDPVEDEAFKHNALIRKTLPDPNNMFSPSALKRVVTSSNICINYSWDAAMWLAYYKASSDPSGYLALIAHTTLQFVMNGHIAVVKREPQLDLTLWAVKDPKREVTLSGPLASGLLIVPTADAALPMTSERELMCADPRVTSTDSGSLLDAARTRPSACILLNVGDKKEEFGKGWIDGSFAKSKADEAEVMLGTALVPYMLGTFKKEFGALTESIGTERGNVALVRDLLVVREGVRTGFKFVEGRATVNVACSEGCITDDESFRKVVTSLLVAAAKNGLKTVVVGSLCFNDDVKKLFVDIVKTNFRGFFDEVVFVSK